MALWFSFFVSPFFVVFISPWPCELTTIETYSGIEGNLATWNVGLKAKRDEGANAGAEEIVYNLPPRINSALFWALSSSPRTKHWYMPRSSRLTELMDRISPLLRISIFELNDMGRPLRSHVIKS